MPPSDQIGTQFSGCTPVLVSYLEACTLIFVPVIPSHFIFHVEIVLRENSLIHTLDQRFLTKRRPSQGREGTSGLTKHAFSNGLGQSDCRIPLEEYSLIDR